MKQKIKRIGTAIVIIIIARLVRKFSSSADGLPNRLIDR